MLHKPVPHNPRSCYYHRNIADKLVNHLGYRGAVQACQENHWLGIIDELMNNKRIYCKDQ